MHTTPVSLLQRLREEVDRSSAWNRFVNLYTPLIYHWGRRAGLQSTDASDLVQEVLVTLLRAMPEFSYDRKQSFRGWLRTITMNKYRDRLRGRKAHPLAGADAVLDDLPAAANDAFEEEEYRREVVRRALQIMQADFQPATWKACWEVVVEGRSAAEVGAELGLNVNAVYAAKFRIMARLREELTGLLD